VTCCSARPDPTPAVTTTPSSSSRSRRLRAARSTSAFAGLGARLAARIAGEIGDHIEQFTTPNCLQCYAGAAPVTRRSGKRALVVAHRQACNRYLADAVPKWAFASLCRSGWAMEFYQAKKDCGNSHNAALRALGNR
jgi:transposase